MSSIYFFNDDVYYILKDKKKIRQWLFNLIMQERSEIDEVNVVFTTDERLKEINNKFLNHDYFTDIITFQDDSDIVSGEIYISIDRVKENAKDAGHAVKDELHRVIAHGFLHMCGYKDKSRADKVEMRSREDFYLTLRKF